MTAPAGTRPTPERARFTSRAAVLAVVICAIALSLAYPVREYIGQRRQIAQQARDQLHMCLPSQTCYVVIPGRHFAGLGAAGAQAPLAPWYERLWHSVRAANQVSGK